jgi:hypothetical protein
VAIGRRDKPRGGEAARRAVKAMSDKRADRREEQHRREREHAAETGGAKDRPPAVIDDTGMVANEAFITEVESKADGRRARSVPGTRA